MKIACVIWLALSAFLHAAGLEFESPLMDVKAPADVTEVTADFKFTNKGERAITISKSDPGCSCLKVQISGGKLKYAPGESGVIRATFEMGNFSGTVDKSIGIWLDDHAEDTPSLRLTVRVHIPVLVAIEPEKTLFWKVGQSPEPKTLRIRMAEGQLIKVTGVSCSNQEFSHALKTIEEGKLYELIVTPVNVSAPRMGVIRIQTDCAIARHRVQQAFAVVRNP